MLGLNVDLATFVNLLLASVLGGLISYGITWWSSRSSRKRFEILAEFLERDALRRYEDPNGMPVFFRDQRGEVTGAGQIVVKTVEMPYEHLGPDGEA